MFHGAENLSKLVMTNFFKGKEIFKPANTGWLTPQIRCIREHEVNLYLYTKGQTTIMIDAGYRDPRLFEKLQWLDLSSAQISHILLTHQDMDHVGAVETGSPPKFAHAKLYLGAEEHRYLTGERERKLYGGRYTRPRTCIAHPMTLLHDREKLDLGGIRVETFLVPGHTWGHLVYLVEEQALFAGDAIRLGPDGGTAFLNILNEDNALACRSLVKLKAQLESRGLQPAVFTGHTGWTADFQFAFAHPERCCNAWVRQKPHDPAAPRNAFSDAEDTKERARATKNWL